MKKKLLVFAFFLAACASMPTNALGTPISQVVSVPEATAKPAEIHVSVTCVEATPPY